MLKHLPGNVFDNRVGQPPSGGCVLKHYAHFARSIASAQPPSGGCVLKPCEMQKICHIVNQPPSGGCVLKQFI